MTFARGPRAFKNAFKNMRLKVYKPHPKQADAAPATPEERRRRNNVERKKRLRPGSMSTIVMRV
jgi:hypothetical protein